MQGTLNNNEVALEASFSPSPLLENQQQQQLAAGAEATAAVVFVSPQPQDQLQQRDFFVTSPGKRLGDNFKDLVETIQDQVAEPFKEFEVEMQVREKSFFSFRFTSFSATYLPKPSFLLPNRSLPTKLNQSELASIRGLTDSVRASRAESEASLRRSKLKLKQLKTSLMELEDDVEDCDVDDGNGRNETDEDDDLFGDADTVAARSSGRFSDPPIV